MEPLTVTLSLISHTNVGKTTLARTLLRRDVGEVLDQAHVTQISESHELIRTDRERLRLWDTPGFGDTARLMRRLRREHDPIGWFLHQVWDRVMDQPLWCSQEAARNIKEEADVVLYLVNAAEEPEQAGYIAMELDLLTWIDRPVLLLLNQVGGDADGLRSRWREYVQPWSVVRDVQSLDAFTRGWPQEQQLLERVVDLLDDPQRAAMAELARAWRRRNLGVFHACCDWMAGYLARAAAQREVFSTLNKKTAMSKLNERLDGATRELMDRMIAEHGLYGGSAERIEQRMQDFIVRGAVPITPKSGAIAGAVVSGALGGLAADVLAGGLTLGGGLIAGGILGALGGSALARGYRLVGGRDDPSVQWSPDFLDQLCRQVLVRYLAVAHFGRGRGAFHEVEQPAHWGASVDLALSRHTTALRRIWTNADRHGDASDSERALRSILEKAAAAALEAGEPGHSDVANRAR